MNKVWCELKTLWNEIWHGSTIEGHNFVEKEIIKNIDVVLLRCNFCGYCSVAWTKDIDKHDEIDKYHKCSQM